MTGTSIDLDEAIGLTRTGDLWLFRGRSLADRAIQFTTNSPVNHVGMAVVVEDMPAMMWHAELGRSLLDLWSGTHHRGVQLHDLRSAVVVWANRYGQRAWLRQLEPPVAEEAEDAALRVVARLDGTPFPSTAELAGRWLRGRIPVAGASAGRWVRDRVPSPARLEAKRQQTQGGEAQGREAQGREAGGRRPLAVVPEPGGESERRLENAYCAEVVALTYEAMGLLSRKRRSNWYDPGRFWSGDDLELAGGARLGGEIPVRVPS